jgi:hypothetical protein
VGRLLDKIRTAVDDGRYVVAWHADERCEERAVTAWQLVVGLTDAELTREYPRSRPNPTALVRETLADGTEVEVVWAWLAQSGRAKLVTVFFPE